MSKRLMCHVVAGYPDADQCLELIRGLALAGAAAIEVQVPFSDPIADGETIMRANDVALNAGMTTAGSFKLIEQARSQGVDCDVYIMSYLQKALHFGLEAFCQAAVKAGVRGLIIPDVPPESPEYAELVGLTRRHRLELVPVLSPGMPAHPLTTLLRTDPAHVYVTSRRGITGDTYADTDELKRFVADIKEQSKASVMIGFGIATAEDVDHALRLGDTAIVGSAIVNRLQTGGSAKTLDYVSGLMKGKS